MCNLSATTSGSLMTRHAEDEVTICASIATLIGKNIFDFFLRVTIHLGAFSVPAIARTIKAPRIDGRNNDNEMLRTYFLVAKLATIATNVTPATEPYTHGFFNRCAYFSPSVCVGGGAGGAGGAGAGGAGGEVDLQLLLCFICPLM